MSGTSIIAKFSMSLRWAPTFSFDPSFPCFFLKMSYYPFFFTLKCHLLDENTEFFIARSKLAFYFFQGANSYNKSF